jgi:hypothetical protein
MKIPRSIALAIGGILCMAQIGMSQDPSAGKSLADIAREARSKRAAENQSQGPTFQAQGLPEQTRPTVRISESGFRTVILNLLTRRDYAGLDDLASAARLSRDRVEGGTWKLYLIYDAVASPASGDRAGTDEWDSHIRVLEDWVKARPDSITARVALAESYRLAGWKARGHGFADTVTDAGWAKFNAQGIKAVATLLEAEKLPTKCPHWYFVMLELARDQGVGKEETREVFERAIAFEPAYYHYYREYVVDLLPKWHGKPGEAEAFAEESNRRIGGRAGAFVYFEIATVLYCMCTDGQVTPTLSWPTLQEGFKEVAERYGATPMKLNRFAVLAYLYRDREVARKTFASLGDQWEPTVWRKRETFNTARIWAGSIQ